MQTMESKVKLRENNMKVAPFLEVENVSKIYQTPRGEYTVLDGVNLEIQEGQFVCIIGHSGCGKSTLLNMVSGFNQPTDGTVKLQGKVITEPGPDRMVVFQNYSLLPWLSAKENIYLGVESVYPDKTKEEHLEIVNAHLELVGLTEAAQKRPPQLSGGMKQRVAIARALATRPQVLILDEPFGALDPITREELQEELLKIWQEHQVTILMITHDIDEALFLSDRIVMMTNGPSAKIGEVLEIPFKRPRDRALIMEDPRYYELRNYALDFLFRRFAHHEEGEDTTATETSTSLPTIPQDVTKATVKADNVLADSLVKEKNQTSTKPLTAMSSQKTERSSDNLPTLVPEEEHPPVTGPKLIALGVAYATFMATLLGINIMSYNIKPGESSQQAQTESSLVSSAPPSPEPTAPVAPATTVPMVAGSPAPMATTATTAPTTAPVPATPTEPSKISDTTQLAELKKKLFEQLDKEWQTPPTFTEPLTYQVKVKANSEIASYEPSNQVAKDYVKEIPLSKIVVADMKMTEPLAEFKVTFTPNNNGGGVLQVE